FDDVIADFLRRMAVFMVPALLLLAILDALAVGRVLKPVSQLSRDAAAIGPGQLDLRLSARGVPTEVQPLIRSFNDALDRLERAFHLQRDFAADVAHELRTPLSTLRMRIDALPNVDAVPLRKGVDTMNRIIAQLLELAELEAGELQLDDVVDLRKIAIDVLEMLVPLALAQDKDLALTGTEAPVLILGNAALLVLAVRNLVENAIQHTLPKTVVELRVDPEGIVQVIDEGLGVAENERDLIFRRFWRRSRAQAGSVGIGLAIVARVAEAHGGSIAVTENARRGATFTLDLTGRPAPHTGAQ
ncbi:MAG: HAMP domain-containing histidine kinase, partial [Alphaproteobacteria bacterium]|nr:HAMP domain-containing histidine kinase [Alphaproteobacteria bacterium]